MEEPITATTTTTNTDANTNTKQPQQYLTTPSRNSSSSDYPPGISTAARDFNHLNTDEFDLQELQKRRPATLSRTQSSHDIRHDGYSTKSTSQRRPKKSRSSSSSTSSAVSAGPGGSGGGHKTETGGYRRSVSTPLLLLTKGSSLSSSLSKAPSTTAASGQNSHLDRMDSSPDSDTSMSPPLKSSYSSSDANLTSSASSSMTGSMGFGHRLAGLAQRLGVYRVRGSTLMVVDL